MNLCSCRIPQHLYLLTADGLLAMVLLQQAYQQVMYIQTAGVYHVTYQANFGGCTDSAQKTINIVNKPVASFNSPSVRTACSAPLTVQFANTSTGATAYIWDFGDSTTSTDINPVHTYTDTGVFTVRLIASNGAGGCGDTIIQTQFVKISAPDIKGFLNFPYADVCGCSCYIQR